MTSGWNQVNVNIFDLTSGVIPSDVAPYLVNGLDVTLGESLFGGVLLWIFDVESIWG